MKSDSRRDFIKKSALATAGISFAGASSAASYKRILGANDRVNIGIIGCGRRFGAYHDLVSGKHNVRLNFVCDVKQSQREKAAAKLKSLISYKPKFVEDIKEVLDSKDVDAIINATPDHWHAPGAWMAMEAGKHVYVEKPCSHNPWEGELLIHFADKYNKVVQMGNQQRSSGHTQEIIKEIHNGVIGTPYKAVAFYNNRRGEVPLQKKQAPPSDLNWELFQGPAPRREYTDDTWNYNWHWYGWTYGTAETGNNGTHELDVARWAMQVKFPNRVEVESLKGHFKDDGWEMYDTMYATFKFDGDKTINWDGKSRNGYSTYSGGRGTVIYGSEGTVFVDRSKYELYDRNGKMVKNSESGGDEGGLALGGGGDMSTNHLINFAQTIRGVDTLNSPIDEGAASVHLCHLANISSRISKPFDVDVNNGHIYDRDAMKLWKREYEPGWEPKV